LKRRVNLATAVHEKWSPRGCPLFVGRRAGRVEKEGPEKGRRCGERTKSTTANRANGQANALNLVLLCQAGGGAVAPERGNAGFFTKSGEKTFGGIRALEYSCKEEEGG